MIKQEIEEGVYTETCPANPSVLPGHLPITPLVLPKLRWTRL